MAPQSEILTGSIENNRLKMSRNYLDGTVELVPTEISISNNMIENSRIRVVGLAAQPPREGGCSP
jgi:predicted peptidase